MAAHGSLTALDRAVFTSAQSLTGRGYRVVAVTPSVSADEKKTLATMSPSHDAMCDSSESATGLAFYALQSGRFCVAHTCHVGMEQSARGGLRVFTQAFILSPSQFDSFGCNPFAVVRALNRAGVLNEPMPQTGQLGPVSVPTSDDAQPRTIMDGFVNLGHAAMLCLAFRATQHRPVIAVGLDNAPERIEALILTLPWALRQQCTFSIGLRFALSRRYFLTSVQGDIANAKRTIRGQKVDLIENWNSDKLPQWEPGPWFDMLADCAKTQNMESLLQLNARLVDDVSHDLLDRVAERQIRLNHIADTSTEELINTVREVTQPTAGHPGEQWLESEYHRVARLILIRRFKAMTADDLGRWWPTIVSLAESNSDFASLCHELSTRIDDLKSPSLTSSTSAHPDQYSV